MGLIQAAMGAAGGVLADQWREYFYCESIPESVMAVKGQRRVTGRGSNKGVDNIISNGSIIAVADGQCMMIVEQELLCRGWFLPPNTYDCGSFVVNGTAVVGKEPKKPYNRCKSTQKGANSYEISI